MSYFAGELLSAALLNAFLPRNGSRAAVLPFETTASVVPTFADLATVGPSVTITSAGTRALVIWSATMFSGDGAERGGYCDFTISGATTRAASLDTALAVSHGNSFAGFRIGTAELVTISAGSNTYTLKYSSTGGAFGFQRRSLAVIAP